MERQNLYHRAFDSVLDIAAKLPIISAMKKNLTSIDEKLTN